MARLKEIALGRGGDSFLFDPEAIQEKPGYNVRDMESPETQSHIRRMADSIHAGGTASFPPIIRADGAMIGTQKLKQAVEKATEAGKPKATNKHIEQSTKPRLARILDEICKVLSVESVNYEELPALLRQRLEGGKA